MAVIPLNSYPADYSTGASNEFGIADVQANAGDYILFTVQYSDAGGSTISSAPTWNGQTMVSAGPRVNAYMWTQTWAVFALATATADILCPGEGFYIASSCARTYSGVTSAAAIIQQVAPDPWSNPSLNSPVLAAGDLIDEILNASGFGPGFSDATATTWAEANSQTRRETIATPAITLGTMVYSTKDGTGALTLGYTASASEPNYVHSILHLIAGDPAPTIDTLTTDGSPGLVVGQPFAMTTTGLGTITSITITTAATPTATTTATSLSLPSGDGTAAARSWVDAEFYAFPGTVTVVSSDGTLTATGSYTLSMPDDYLDVVFADVETTDGDQVPGVEGLAIYLNVSRSSVKLWATQNARFSATVEQIKAIQAKKLINMGLSGDFNSSITKLMLNNHGYTEKLETQNTHSFESLSDDELTAKIKSLLP